MRTRSGLLGAITLFVLGAAAPALAAADVPLDDWADHPGGRDPDARTGSYLNDDDGWRAEFSLGLGYSRINFEGSPPLIDGRDCVHLEPVLSFSPLADLPQFRVGAALGI